MLRTAAGRWIRGLRRVGERGWRQGLRLRVLQPDGLFQPEAVTFAGRYDRLFAAAAAELSDASVCRLLSFGCADGTDLIDLRRFFPQALLVGLDINSHNIDRARARCRKDESGAAPDMIFKTASTAAAELEESYDAVFALAVFRHSDLDGAPARCDHVLPFAAVAREAAVLTARVRPGGLFGLINAHYRGGDLPALAAWERVSIWPRRPAPVYGPDSRLLGFGLQDEGLWRKPAIARDHQ